MTRKRRLKRLSILAIADLRIGKRKTPERAYVANITREGIGLYIQDILPIGSEVAVTLRFLNHEGRELTEKIEGEVVWCRKAFAAGIALEPLTKKGHPCLATFLEALKRSPR